MRPLAGGELRRRHAADPLAEWGPRRSDAHRGAGHVRSCAGELDEESAEARYEVPRDTLSAEASSRARVPAEVPVGFDGVTNWHGAAAFLAGAFPARAIPSPGLLTLARLIRDASDHPGG